jgi:hypothetical protein
MKLNRREFVAATLAPITATAGCTSGNETGPEELYIETDLEKAELEVSDHDIFVNVYTLAEDSELETLELQYMEPGSDTWEILSREEASGGEAAFAEPYHPGEPGEYRFRSAAEAGGEKYFSEQETVEFVEDLGNGFL